MCTIALIALVVQRIECKFAVLVIQVRFLARAQKERAAPLAPLFLVTVKIKKATAKCSGYIQ